MDPVIRNLKDVSPRGDAEQSRRLIGPEDSPPTNVLLFIVIPPGETSALHTHLWEHTTFIVEGSGLLWCSGKEFPLKAGDAVLIPPNQEHQIRNTGGVPMSRIAVNPLNSVQE